LGINVVESGVEAQLIVKGNVNINSNGLVGLYDSFGMYSFLVANTKLEINVENGSTLESCGNDDYDISVSGFDAPSAATFSGDGSYTCDQAKVVFNGDVTVDEPVCQACPDP
jgi:hypothetical protein